MSTGKSFTPANALQNIGKAKKDSEAPKQETKPTPKKASVKKERVSDQKRPIGETSILTMKVSQLRMWKYANRPDAELGDITDLAIDIRDNGQISPVIARPVKKSGEVTHEVIAGRRRYEACKFGDLPVMVIVRDLSDSDAFQVMESENDRRESISTWAKAKSYQMMIDDIYESVAKLAYSIDVPKESIHRLLRYNKIPDDLCELIGDMSMVSFRIMEDLVKFSNENKNYMELLTPYAEHLRSGKMPQIKTDLFVGEKRVVKDSSGNSMFSISKSKSSGAITINVLRDARRNMDIGKLEEELAKLAEKL